MYETITLRLSPLTHSASVYREHELGRLENIFFDLGKVFT